MTYSSDASCATTVLNQCCLIQLPILFTVAEAIKFKQQFQDVCTHNLPKRIVLDFGQTTFVDSGGIGALVACMKVAQSQGIELSFWSFSEQIKLLLAATGLDQVFIAEKYTTAILANGGKITTESPVTHPSINSKVKRAIDIVGALVGLGVTGVLFVPVAIAIKMDSSGGILFSQTRCGWMGKRFRLWKFRSMVKDAPHLRHQVENEISGAFFKNANDPRVTKVGRLLRKTSLDEFPQFWNVLTGEMSLVGTRPPTPDELEQYEIPEWQRLDVKPGLTGEWQVNGRSTVKTFEEVIQLDLKYQQNWSLKYDLALILKTIIVIFRKDSGAV